VVQHNLRRRAWSFAALLQLSAIAQAHTVNGDHMTCWWHACLVTKCNSRADLLRGMVLMDRRIHKCKTLVDCAPAMRIPGQSSQKAAAELPPDTFARDL
jgi:hypothetical protein